MRKNNLKKLHDEGVAYLTDYILGMDIWKRQEFFLNCIKIIDKTFFDSISIEDNAKRQFFTEIASLLGIKAKYVDKTKIYLFAIGREHGNYSGAGPDTPNCVWVQWYHFLNYILRVGREEKRISAMHEDLKKESPHAISMTQNPRIYKYGKYRFVL